MADVEAFWAEYTGNERIDLGHEFYVDVKRCLSQREKESVGQILVSPIHETDAKSRATRMRTDVTGAQFEEVFLSVVDWNLTDREGNELPLKPESVKRESLHALPGPVFDKIFVKVEELNGERPAEEQSKFSS